MRRSGLAVFGSLAGLVLALQAFPVNSQPAKVLYALRATPIFAAAGGHAVGKLTPGAPLTAVGLAKGGYQPFMIAAWSQQDDDQTLVLAQGQRIVLATLAAGVHTKIVSSAKDDYGNVWHKVELTGFVAASALSADQTVVWTQAHALYATRCSACHALHKTTEFTANQWPAIVTSMTKNAALRPDQAALITQYLQTHAK
jgi:trimethylamine-N-oxide reductase cytochrome c-type subunit TorC